MGSGIENMEVEATPKVVDRQIYNQVAASRNRMSQQLSAKNKYIRHLEKVSNQSSQAIGEAHAALVRVAHELKVIRRLSQAAVAAASYGVDEADANARTQLIIQRMESLQKGIEREAEELDKMVLREVPVTWQGVASDVRLLGDFDNWTKGFGLSPGETQDATFTKFTANIPLPPGRYLVKFKVDDAHWRLASDWPTSDNPDGSTNNILLVS